MDASVYDREKDRVLRIVKFSLFWRFFVVLCTYEEIFYKYSFQLKPNKESYHD